MSLTNLPAPRTAVIGMGGFAQQHHRALLSLEEESACRLVCTCDPQPDRFANERARWRLAERGVGVYTDYKQMLDAHAHELDLVSVPTPLPLHAPMHQACVERGLACYLEKPPTLYFPELEQMLATEARAARQTQVAFNFIVEPERQALKERILSGEWGRVQSVRFVGLWPRATSYFTRSAWAGRLRLDGRPVLDTCLGNAMAHYVHNVLFWCGDNALLSWAPVAEARAELYRAHAIETFDTAFVEGRCANGVVVRIAATHACDKPTYHREEIECERATITYQTGDRYHIRKHDGSEETALLERRDLLAENFRHYLRYVRGDVPRPLTRLIDSQPFIHFYDLIYVAARHIARVGADHVARSSAGPDGDEYVAVRGVRERCEDFVATGRTPFDQGVAWARAGGHAFASALPNLDSALNQMETENAR